MTDTRAGELREQLHELGAPLKQQLHQLDAELDAKQAELAELRALRSDVGRMTQLLDPDWHTSYEARRQEATGRKRPGPKRNGGPPLRRPKAKAPDDMLAWLREHRAEFPDGFVATELANHRTPPVRSQSYAGTLLAELAERGQVRLDHLGGPTRTTKFYKLVEEG